VIIRKDGLQLTHLYTGEDGESHVEEVEYALEPFEGGAGADHIPISGITFRLWDNAPPKHDYHNTSKPQLVIHLAGSVEVECSDGEKRVLNTGDIMVSENVAPGMGHISNELAQPRLQLLVPYLDGFLPRREAASIDERPLPE
jgi:quercetin dioxygenase-like cupin family protein